MEGSGTKFYMHAQQFSNEIKMASITVGAIGPS